jgi:hypothetical protein
VFNNNYYTSSYSNGKLERGWYDSYWIWN